MIVSELKPFAEVLGYLEGEKKVFLVGCKGCAEAPCDEDDGDNKWHTGTPS